MGLPAFFKFKFETAFRIKIYLSFKKVKHCHHLPFFGALCFITDLMLMINLLNSTAYKFRIDCFISDLSMRRTSTASGSLENLKGHHEELYPHYHLVMSRHSIYIRTVHTVSFLEELRIPIFFFEIYWPLAHSFFRWVSEYFSSTAVFLFHRK